MMIVVFTWGLVGLAGDAQPSDLLGRFRESLSAEQLARVEGILRDPEPGTLTHALYALHPQLVATQKALNQNQPQVALDALEALGESEKPFLFWSVRLLTARALLVAQRYEQAIACMAEILEGGKAYIENPAEVAFTKAITEFRLTQRQAAAQTLGTLQSWPDLNPEARQRAEEMLKEIATYDESGLEEAVNLMFVSGYRLAKHDLSEDTLAKEARILEIIDAALAEAQPSPPPSGSMVSGGGGKLEGAPIGAEESFAPPAGSGATALRDRVAASDGDWAKAYQREREGVATTVDDSLPARYNDLIKQYYDTLDRSND